MACIYKINGKTFNTTEEIQNYVSSDEFVSVLAKGNLGISKEIRNLILVGGENPALRDVESTTKALEELDKESINNLEKLSNIYYHGNPTKKVIDKLEDRGNGIHIGTKEQAKEFLNLSGTEGTLYKVKLSAKEIIEGIDEENQANFTQKDVDELVDKYMNSGDSYMTAFNKAQAELRNPFLYKNQIGKADALKYLNTKEGSLSDYSIVTFNPNLTEIVSVVSYDKSGKIIIFDNTTKSISESYHKAKADDSNPKLAKAVESLLSKEQPKAGSESKSSEPSKSDKNYQEAQEVNAIVSKENPDASVLIQPKGEDLSLTAVYVGKEKRGKGIGSKVLESVKKQADKLGKKVVLDATNELDSETDLEKLDNFYKKNGFLKVGENKYEYDPKAKDSSGDIVSRTDDSGTKKSDIAAVTNKGQSDKNVDSAEEVAETSKPKPENVKAIEEATEKEITTVAEKASITPKNAKDLYKVNRKLFGLNKVQALASAITMDRMVGAMAKRAGITKTEMYGRLKFEKASEDFVKNLSKKAKVLWQIVGENANLSQTIKDNLRLAREMELAGKDAKTIRLATGWEKGADKKWKFEIFSGELKGKPRTIEDKLSNLLDNKELFEMYPQLKDINVNLRLNGFGTGNYSLTGIVVNGGIRDMLSILNHEVQHAIQDIEGFARGANLETISEDLYNIFEKYERVKEYEISELKGLFYKKDSDGWSIGNGYKTREEAEEALAEEKLNLKKISDIYSKLIGNAITEKEAFDLYKKTAGEVESRNVQKRMEISNEQKRNTLLSETEDIARDEQIVLFQKSDGNARGAAMVSMDGQAVIYALTDPNVSTPLHELAHVFEHYLTDAEKLAVKNWAGTKQWDVQTSEKFARGFEKYLAEDKAPNSALEKVFANFKEWLTEIYNGIVGSDIDIELNDDMRELYSKMLGEDFSTQEQEATPQVKEANVKAIEEAITKKSGTIKNEIIKEAADPTEVKKILDNLDAIKSKLAGFTTKDGDRIFSEECKWG